MNRIACYRWRHRYFGFPVELKLANGLVSRLRGFLWHRSSETNISWKKLRLVVVLEKKEVSEYFEMGTSNPALYSINSEPSTTKTKPYCKAVISMLFCLLSGKFLMRQLCLVLNVKGVSSCICGFWNNEPIFQYLVSWVSAFGFYFAEKLFGISMVCERPIFLCS